MNFFLPLAMLATAVAGLDEYRESIVETTLPDGSRLVRFLFSISTPANPSSHLMDIFPQAIASVLGPDRATLRRVQGNIVRGRWRDRAWGPNPLRPVPFGASMEISPPSSHVWSKSAWLFSSVMGASFESLSPEQSSFSWITPVDLPWDVRAGANPNEGVCTENLERWVELLPCRGRRGMGAEILRLSDEMARSEFLLLTLRGKIASSGEWVATGEVAVHLDAGSPTLVTKACPATAGLAASPRTHPTPAVVVGRSIVGTARRPERTHGKLLLSLAHSGKDSDSHTLELFEQLPYFLVPLWSTHSVRSSTGRDMTAVVPTIRSTDGIVTPSHIVWTLDVLPGETVTVAVDLHKRWIPIDRLSFSFEKGFDVGSAIVRIDKARWDWTRGLVVLFPMPDPTTTFNTIAVASTALSLFFGLVLRNFLSKRSTLVGTDPASLAAREAPIVRMGKWIYARIVGMRRNKLST